MMASTTCGAWITNASAFLANEEMEDLDAFRNLRQCLKSAKDAISVRSEHRNNDKQTPPSLCAN